MASLNTRDAGREFSGNGASSFDEPRVRFSPADVAPLSAEKIAAVEVGLAQIERAFGRNAPVFGGFRKDAA